MAGKLTLLHDLDFSVLQQCIHCGMCLPTCPTYRETGRERNSPRGRIALMRAVAENELTLSPAFAEEMNYCLGCLACVSACPAGVNYTELLETARAASEESRVVPGNLRRVLRWILLRQLFLRPRLLRAVGRLLEQYQRCGAQAWFRRHRMSRLLPRRLGELEPFMPHLDRRFSDQVIAARETPAMVRHRVMVLTGCVQDLVYSEVNRATVDALLANDCEVFTPRMQSCCGSLHAHNGDLEAARILARRQIDALELEKVDAIISNAAGCGSHLKHYGRLLADDPAYAARATAWDKKVRDIAEWLVEIGFRAPRSPSIPEVKGEGKPLDETPARPNSTVVTYHDACHLCHGQGVTRQPRQLLEALPGVELQECAESTWCCGSAGIYALTHPRTAADLRMRKWKNLEATGASVVALGNPGCAMYLETKPGEARRLDLVHPVVLLARAYAAEEGRAAVPGK